MKDLKIKKMEKRIKQFTIGMTLICLFALAFFYNYKREIMFNTHSEAGNYTFAVYDCDKEEFTGTENISMSYTIKPSEKIKNTIDFSGSIALEGKKYSLEYSDMWRRNIMHMHNDNGEYYATAVVRNRMEQKIDGNYRATPYIRTVILYMGAPDEKVFETQSRQLLIYDVYGKDSKHYMEKNYREWITAAYTDMHNI